MTITIIGAGAIGQAIQRIVSPKNRKLQLWDKAPGKVQNQLSLNQLIPKTELLFFCVPSWSLMGAVEEVKTYLGTKTILVGISKGLQTEGQLRTDEVLAKQFPENPIAVLSGPMLASEIEEGKPAYAVIAAAEVTTRQRLAELFSGTRLGIELSDDPKAVAVAGVLKNIYAMVLGMADALECGYNTKGWIVYQALQEMELIASELKTDPRLMRGSAGLADLITTGFSQSSSNFRVGQELIQTSQITRQSEGLVSLPSLLTLLGNQTEPLPLLHALGQCLVNQKEAKAHFTQVLKRSTAQD